MAVDSLSGLISGKRGYVQIYDPDTQQVASYAFGEWSAPLRAEFIKRNNFLAQGFQTGVSGFKSTQLRIKGPYLQGPPPLTVGEFYLFFLGITDDGPLELVVFGHVSEMPLSNSAEGAPDLELTVDSVGEFSAATPG